MKDSLQEKLKTAGAVWPVIIALVAFGGKIYTDVEMLKVNSTKLENNVIYINTQLAETQKTLAQLVAKMDTRLTVVEKRIDWDRKVEQNVSINGK